MQLTAISPRLLATRTAVARQADDPSPAPPPDIDFSTIDTPQKAALLPNVGFAAFVMNQNSLLAALQNGLDMKASVQMTVGGSTPMNLNYQYTNSKLQMQAQGTFGNVPVTETWTVDPEQLTMTITGTIGNTPENLVYAIKQGDATYHLDGNVGDIPVHEALDVPADTEMTCTGTLGDQPLNQTLTILNAGTQKPATLHVEGTLGTAPILSDETVTSTANLQLNLTGQGNIAGTPMQISQSFTYSQPSTPPPPSGTHH